MCHCLLANIMSKKAERSIVVWVLNFLKMRTTMRMRSVKEEDEECWEKYARNSWNGWMKIESFHLLSLSSF